MGTLAKTVKTVQKGIVGCRELGQAGFIETYRCCKRCHSADEYALAGFLGPCRATLPDGREALVCCSGRKQLLGRVGR